ncbi:MAG: hypothetical protein GF308_19775 [Candidatus Heimdallarchaeota archaeon]|nr:hypothetical protein [Candidatus Heimdallarchaeota archaeon]
MLIKTINRGQGWTLPEDLSQKELNEKIVDTLHKIISPQRLSQIYDRVISYQKTHQDLERQTEVLGIIQEYIQEIDGYLQE